MSTTAKQHRRTGFVPFPVAGWLGVVAMLAIAILGPSATLAAGPGGDDNLPNSGHTSNTGGIVPTMLKNAEMTCDENSSVQNISGQFTLSGTAGANTYVVIYLTPNNGSDASPVDNVEDNEVKVDISGQSGTVNFSLNITSPFTTTKGGVLAVFAMDVDGTIFTSKSNSLNCTEGEPTPPPPTNPPPTNPPPTNPPPTNPPPTNPPPTNPPPTNPPPTATPTGTVVPEEPTPTPTGGVEAATGTPRVTLPPTDTVGGDQQGGGSWRMLLIVMAGLLAGILALSPRQRVRR
jgi:hypothetical protein